MDMKALFLLLCFRGPYFCKSELSTTLRVAYLEGGNPEAVIVETDDKNLTKLEGHAAEMLNWIAADQNFSYEVVEIDFTEGFYGMTKQLSTKNVDLALDLFDLQTEGIENTTELFPYVSGTYSLITPFPKYQSDPWSCFKPFTLIVWILILVSLITVTLLLQILIISTHRTDSKKQVKSQSNDAKSWADSFVYVLGVVTNQDGYWSSRTRPSRLIAGVWCLAALVFVNAYSGSLITYMTTPKVKPLLSSIEDLAQRNDIQLLSQNFAIRVMIERVSGNLKPLAANVARIPRNFCGTTFSSEEFRQCLERVRAGDHVFAMYTLAASIVISDDFHSSGECSLTLAENQFFPSYSGFVAPLNKTHSFRNSMDKSILRAVSYGFVQKWMTVYDAVKPNPCLRFKPKNEGIKKLTLTAMTGSFILLAVGHVVSLVAFLCEHVSCIHQAN